MTEARKKIWLIFATILLVAIFTGLVDLPENQYLSRFGLGFFNRFKIHLGLDLAGGTRLTYQADMSNIPQKDQDSSLQGVREVIERRVNAFGVAEPVIQTSKEGGNRRVIVELAGIKDVGEAIKMIGETPYLDFREIAGSEAEELLKKKGEEKLDDKKIFKVTGLSGKQLKGSTVEFDNQTGSAVVALEFNDEGKKLFSEITSRNVGKPVAIYLDSFPISTPVVQTPILDGRAIITGNFDLNEAKMLATRLNAGALPVGIKLVSQETVGANLGQESLALSLRAGIVGIILVALFMIIYYRLSGLVSVVSLGIYALIVFAFIKMIPITLSLAGVTGFIVSLGMAVDANVLIFERMKEELRLGRTLGVAIEEGFLRAWSSIRDSNFSTLLTTLILYIFGSGVVKGFAVTLSLGVLVSMFSAITITRTILRLLVNNKIVQFAWLFKYKKLTKNEN